RRCKRPQKAEPAPNSDDQINGNNGPGYEGRSLIQISNRTTLDLQPTQCHRRCVQGEGNQQQKIVDPVVLPKPATPEEDRIDHTEAIKDHGQYEEVSIWMFAGEPGHSC